uniref:Uncharacterized protein n=1 Tax=Phlebotomus papatasi TaxID=29031 RepID=A0A1B0DI82_PHLPP
MNYYVQMQDDFLDCFGDPEVTGKIGTDIQDGKCTWLAVVCLQRATSAQKEIMRECYGKNDPEAIARIKQLYDELSLPNTYATYEEDSCNVIKKQIQQIPGRIHVEIYLKIMNQIYRREW